jgi:hypothetical protein
VEINLLREATGDFKRIVFTAAIKDDDFIDPFNGTQAPLQYTGTIFRQHYR